MMIIDQQREKKLFLLSSEKVVMIIRVHLLYLMLILQFLRNLIISDLNWQFTHCSLHVISINLSIQYFRRWMVLVDVYPIYHRVFSFSCNLKLGLYKLQGIAIFGKLTGILQSSLKSIRQRTLHKTIKATLKSWT